MNLISRTECIFAWNLEDDDLPVRRSSTSIPIDTRIIARGRDSQVRKNSPDVDKELIVMIVSFLIVIYLCTLYLYFFEFLSWTGTSHGSCEHASKTKSRRYHLFHGKHRTQYQPQGDKMRCRFLEGESKEHLVLVSRISFALFALPGDEKLLRRITFRKDVSIYFVRVINSSSFGLPLKIIN